MIGSQDPGLQQHAFQPPVPEVVRRAEPDPALQRLQADARPPLREGRGLRFCARPLLHAQDQVRRPAGALRRHEDHRRRRAQGIHGKG